MAEQDQSVENTFDALAAMPTPYQCSKCHSRLMSVETTFFTMGGKTWNIALPVCPYCDLKEDTAKFVSEMNC